RLEAGALVQPPRGLVRSIDVQAELRAARAGPADQRGQHGTPSALSTRLGNGRHAGDRNPAVVMATAADRGRADPGEHRLSVSPAQHRQDAVGLVPGEEALPEPDVE